MPIVLESVLIENFMPFVGQYEIPLADQGIVFVVGENRVSKMADSNGAGKTSILDAICWASYDKILRGTSGKRFVNNQCTRAVVELYFRLQNGTPYVTKREQSGTTRHWDVYEIQGETRTLIGSGNKVESLFGLTFKAFQNTILFGVSEEKRFGGLSDVPRKQLFDELLDLTFFGEKRKVVETELRLAETTLIQKTRRLEVVQGSLQSLQGELEQLSQKAQEQAAAQARLGLEILQEQRSLYGGLYSLVQDYLKAWQARAQAQETLDGSMALASLRNRLSSQGLNLERDIAKLEQQRDDTIALGACPICRRPTKGHEPEIHHYFDEELYPLQMASLKAEAYELTINRALELWPTLDPQHDHEMLRLECIKRLEQIKAKPWNNLFHEERYFRQGIDELEERIAALTAEASVLAVEKQLADDQVQLREFWVEGFGHRGLKARLLRDYDTFIQGKLAEYSETLTAGELELLFSATKTLKNGEVRDEITFEARNRYGADCYDDLSSGEKQRVDLCLVLALQDVVRDLHRGRFSLALYDEIFEHFDETGCEQVMAFLTEQRAKTGSLFVISQNPKLLSYPSDHIIRVVKTQKGSAIHVD